MAVRVVRAVVRCDTVLLKRLDNLIDVVQSLAVCTPTIVGDDDVDVKDAVFPYDRSVLCAIRRVVHNRQISTMRRLGEYWLPNVDMYKHR